MGSETKVGLLVGMCFIVCFAIILAHRGAPEELRAKPAFEITTAEADPPAQKPATTGAAETQPSVREATRRPATRNTDANELPGRRTQPPSEPAQHLARGAERMDPAASPDPERFTRRTAPIPVTGALGQLAQRDERSETQAQQVLVADVEPADAGEIARPESRDEQFALKPTAEPLLAAGRQIADALSEVGIQLTSRAQQEQQRRQAEAPPADVPEEKVVLAQSTAESERSLPERTELQRSEKAEPSSDSPSTDLDRTAPALADTAPIIRETYAVQAGDSLSKIARRKYGSDHPIIVDAIYNANKERMKSRDRLIVGKELRLPELDVAPVGVQPAAARPVELAEAAPAPKRGEDDATARLRDEMSGATATKEQQPGAEVSALSMLPAKNKAAEPVLAKGPTQTHVVKPGETLSRIVRSHYGTSDPALVRAVYEANRKQMKSPNALAAGMKLVLPTRARPKGDASADTTLVAQAESALTAKVRKAEPLTETEPVLAAADTSAKAAKERWYVIQPGDQLSTVAQKELGSSRRWQEIAKLNQKAFPNPSRIKSGSRIRLPLDGMQTADASTVGAAR